jgi:creatinine amidohydrolase/Fe(II)-dependent formamide hydrolase-like protein
MKLTSADGFTRDRVRGRHRRRGATASRRRARTRTGTGPGSAHSRTAGAAARARIGVGTQRRSTDRRARDGLDRRARDAIRGGKTLAIIGSGGNEQNGPYEPNGKHNYVLRTTCEAIARRLGNALCAPIVTLEPGNPEREGLTPGSVFITAATFNAILTDMSTSLKSMGFKDIVMIADSGGNVNGMRDTAAALNAKWQGSGAHAHYITEYYEEDKWSYNFLKSLGIVQKPDVQSATRWDIHDDYHYEALVALVDPKLVRPEQRIKARKFSIYGVEIGSVQQLLENGRKLAEYRAKITADAIQKSIASSRATQR